MRAIINSNSKIVEKIIRNDAGELYRAYFLVVFRDGKYFAKFVRAEKITGIANHDSQFVNAVIFFPVFLFHNLKRTTNYKLQNPFSPYIFNTFFTSQMTRAPSL